MFKTRVTELFGIKYPIVSGGMMRVTQAELVAAVSNAGALGILCALSSPTPEELAAEIRKTRELTDKPFGVNITILPTLHEINLDAYLDVIISENIKIVETAGRNPKPYMERIKGAGIKVIHKCVAVRFARTAQEIGCDVISIDGTECAGHPGEEDITTLVLTPLTVDAVEIPVIASGGIGDGRGLIAALALGAEGINMGTRFLATQESPVHPKVKEWLVQSSERDAVLVLRSLRNTMRVLKNQGVEKTLELEKKGATIEELAPYVSGSEGRKLLETGNIDNGMLACGQIVGLIREIPTVKELIDNIIDEAQEVLTRMGTEDIFKPVRKLTT